MLFPLSKDFSASSIFQKGEHSVKPISRVWSIDHTGSAERTKELHLLLTDQKPYKCHERLATRRAQEGKHADAERMSVFKEDLRDMYQRIDGEAEERRQEMQREMRAYRKRNADHDASLQGTLRDQAKDHQNFLRDMNERVTGMPPMWGGEPPRETRAQTRARSEAAKGVIQQTKDYKQMIHSLSATLDNRGPQEWTAVPKPSNDAIVRKRKAMGLAKMTQAKAEYEAMREECEDKEQRRVAAERREMQRQCREVDVRLSQDKARCLQALADTGAQKKAELDAIQARVNGRGNGRPDHPEFSGYATAGYATVHKSSTRMRDQAAERADRDANHGESAAKLLCLSMPLNLRNRIVAAKPPKKAASLMGTGITDPMEWTDMNWTHRWALISRHAPQTAVQKAHEKAGIDAQGMDLNTSGVSASEQRTLSPRALGLASS